MNTQHYPAPGNYPYQTMSIRPELPLDYAFLTPAGNVMYTTRRIRAVSYANSVVRQSLASEGDKPAERRETRQKWDWVNTVTWAGVGAGAVAWVYAIVKGVQWLGV